MPAPTELALSTLLPTISFLPPELISLANSLLAQSRSKAAHLKPDEEIARTYACAHIACERLKGRLDLEVEKAKPPCHPRVYARLVGFLEGVLGGGKGRGKVGGGTPGRGGKGTPRGGLVRNEIEGTPSKKTAVVGDDSGSGVEVKTPTTATKIGTKRAKEAEEEEQRIEGLPAFVTPLARALCKAASTPKAVPHIVVGAQAVAAEIASRSAPKAEGSDRKRRKRTPQSAKRFAGKTNADEPVVAATAVAATKWPAILITLHALTVARMRGLEASDAEIGNLKKKAMEAVQTFMDENSHEEGGLDTPVDAKTLRADVEFYTLEAEDCGWLEMEWYHNVPEDVEDQEAGNEDGEEENYDSAEEDGQALTPRRKPYKTPLRRKEKHGGKAALFSAATGEVQDDVGAAGLLPGLGTMFQPGLDWLSEEQRQDYRSWKKDVMREIAAIEAGA